MDIWICRNEINTILTEMTTTSYGRKKQQQQTAQTKLQNGREFI